MTDTWPPGHEWVWFVCDGDQSWPIRYSGALEKDARATYLRHAGLTELPAGWHIWHGCRRRPEIILIY